MASDFSALPAGPVEGPAPRPVSAPAPAPAPAARMSLSRRLCYGFAGVVGVPIGTLLLLLWWVIGLALTMQPGVQATACAAAVVLTYAVRAAMGGSGGAGAWAATEGAAPGWSRELLDIAVAVPALLLVTAVLPRRGWPEARSVSLAVAAAVAATALVIAKGAALGTWALDDGGGANAVLAVAGLLPWVRAAGVARLWRPANEERLIAAERALLALTVKSKYIERSAGGLHVIEVPCTAPAAAAPPPVIVLVHGFGMAAATWMTVLDTFAARFRVIAIDWLGTAAARGGGGGVTVQF